MTNEESNDEAAGRSDMLNETMSVPKEVYADEDSGPYIVLVESAKKDQLIGKLHIMGVGRRLWKAKVMGLQKTERAGENRVKLSFYSGKDANMFLEHPLLLSESWKAYIPLSRIQKKGIIFGVDPQETEEDIMDGIVSERPVVKVRRITKFANGARSNTNVVEITFLGQHLPNSVRIYTVPYKVKLSVPTPFMCDNCYRFGHRAAQCRSDARCKNCSTPYKSDNMPEACKEAKCQRQCGHCPSKDHCSADAKSCPEWQVQKDIKRVMAEGNLSYPEAKKLLKGKKVPGPVFWSAASAAEFPPLHAPTSRRDLHQKPKPVAPLRLNKRKAEDGAEEWVSSPATPVTLDVKKKTPEENNGRRLTVYTKRIGLQHR